MTFLGLLLAYHPAITIPYFYHDEVWFWQRLPGTYPFEETLYSFSIFLGRFIGAYILTWASWSVDSLIDLSTLRFIGLLCLTLTGYLWANWLNKNSFRWVDSIFITLALLTLPTFQVFAMWVVGLHCNVAVLLATIAAMITETISIKKPILHRFLSLNSFFSLLFLVSAWATYQSSATMYWVFSACLILFPHSLDRNEIKGRLINFFSIGFLSLIIYSILTKILHKVLNLYSYIAYDPLGWSVDWVSKIKWFFKEPLINAFNFWNIFPADYFALMVFSFILLTVLFSGFYLQRQKASFAVIAGGQIKIGAVYVGLIVLSFLPNLLSVRDVAYYRCSGALTSIILLTFFWALQQWVDFLSVQWKKNIFTLVLCVFACYGISEGYKNVFYYRVRPSYLETAYLEKAVINALNKGVSHIHFIYPKFSNLKNSRFDEFGTLTTNFIQNQKPLLAGLLKEWANTHNSLLRKYEADKDQNNFYAVFEDKASHQRFSKRLYITHAFEYSKEIPPEATIIDVRRVLLSL